MPRDASDKIYGKIHGSPHLDFETWKDLIRKMGGRFNPEGIEPNAFTGCVCPLGLRGFTAAEVGSNAHRVERTHRDLRLDGADHYCTMFQVAGQSAMTHNEEAVRFDVGDVVLVDMARPATFFNGNAGQSWKSVALILPRRSLVSHLGFEPRGGQYRRNGTAAGRLLLDLLRNSGEGEGSAPSSADSYMRLAVYDLVGALFAPNDPAPSRHADKLFIRVRSVIKDGFADPDFGPCEAATRAGISLRYLQKMFTQRGSTCSEFIYSFRLDHAARLLQRRASLDASQALSEIAYASGFRDYRHFARKFRHRFGHAPGRASPEDHRASCDRDINHWLAML
jgi:AraC family transcriptional regulator, positive regulator of tynA and feaB